MKNIYYLYVIFIVSICAVTFPSCQDTLSLGNEKIIGGEGKGLSVNEAREFFEKDMSEKASRSGKDKKEQKYYTQYFMLPVGDFTPKWEEGISTDAPTLYSVDVPIETSYRYRAIRIDEKTNKPYTTTCYHEMVVVKDQDGKMGYRIVFYIPDREYDLTHGGDISRQLTNGLGMGDYSGLKIYTNTEGQFTRVNRFLNGEKIQAINLNTKQSPKEFAINLLRSLKIIGKIHIQRQKIKTTISRGEDDWYDDWSDWWDDYYDDDSDFEDPYNNSDDNSNNGWWGDNEDALNVNNDYFWQVAEDTYYNTEDGLYYIDIDGDGKIDTGCPEPGSEYTPEDNWPVDDDPIKDPSESDSPNNNDDSTSSTDNDDQAAIGNEGGENNGDEEKVHSISEIKTAAKTVVQKLIESEGKNKAVCNYGVRDMFNSLYSTNELNNMKANEMVQYWRNHPENWEKIDMKQAQKLANEGFFVVAGYRNPNGSGHVVVVVPGEESYSPSWSDYVPKVMDTGEDKRTDSQPLSLSFGDDKINDVEFYKYK